MTGDNVVGDFFFSSNQIQIKDPHYQIDNPREKTQFVILGVLKGASRDEMLFVTINSNKNALNMS
jgi:hypothetical protein